METAVLLPNQRKWMWVEIVLVFLLALGAFWFSDIVSGPMNIVLTLALPITLLASWRGRKDTLATVGIQPQDFSQAKWIALFTLCGAVVVVGIGLLMDSHLLEQHDFGKRYQRKLCEYTWNGFFQQLILQGYFTNRFAAVLKTARGERRGAVVLASGLLFGVIHLPNPILTVITPFVGALSAYWFLKSRNLYLLAVAHAVLGTTLQYFIAAQLFEHPMRVGPHFLE